MADKCQPFLLCVITVEISAFKLFKDVGWHLFLPSRENGWKHGEFCRKKEKLKRDKKLQKLVDLLRKFEIYDIYINIRSNIGGKNMIKEMTEDEVRDLAGKILKFENTDKVQSGVGQLTSFNQLGFNGIKDRCSSIVTEEASYFNY